MVLRMQSYNSNQNLIKTLAIMRHIRQTHISYFLHQNLIYGALTHTRHFLSKNKISYVSARNFAPSYKVWA